MMSEHARHYRAHTPAQKQEIITRLTAIWTAMPEMRLGQLLYCGAGPSIFSIEDYDLIAALEEVASIPSRMTLAADQERGKGPIENRL